MRAYEILNTLQAIMWNLTSVLYFPEKGQLFSSDASPLGGYKAKKMILKEKANLSQQTQNPNFKLAI